MNFQNVVLLTQVLVAAAFVVAVVYKNKTGKYTKGLPWPLEPIAVFLINQTGQPWQAPFFDVIIGHAVMPAVYTAVFKMIGGRLHILLTPRSDNFWKGVVHVPGSIARVTDSPGPYTDAKERVRRGELKGMKYLGDPEFARCGLVITERCTENYVVFVAFTEEDPTVGQFYPIDHLPRNLIRHEREVIIRVAVEKARKLMS